MVDEMQIFKVQAKENLMTLGWIHTHPQFDLFLSSVDLHNQQAYQSQLKEAVAIVVSPVVVEPGFQTFRVRDEHMDDIQGCTREGFHRHVDRKGDEMFEVATHINYTRGDKIKVIDLRKK